ncbi:hypothetical protein GF312_11910 [Candidatus Poribacteria bacterium]|nr:hypothetical protein [Candidatus Poribacteria bacterium]
MIYKKILIVSTALIFIIIHISTASEDRYGVDFLQRLTVARNNGAGYSSASYSIGASALNNNPAGLPFGESNELLINTHKLPDISVIMMKQNLDGTWEDYGRYDVFSNDIGLINFNLPFGKFGSLGIGFAINYNGRFIRVDENGKAVNSFSRDDFAFTLGYGIKVYRGISLGFDVKTVRSKIPLDEEDTKDTIGRTTAANIGFLHQIGNRVRVGAVFQNLGDELSFNRDDIPDELRSQVLIGATCIIKDSANTLLLLNTDINPPFRDGPRYNLGLELVYADIFILRAGYFRTTDKYYEPLVNLNDGSLLDEERVWINKGFTFGLGLRFGSMEFNFARTPRREPLLLDGEKMRISESDPIISFSCNARF